MPENCYLPETWIRELVCNGWVKVSGTVWRSPSGRLFRGPYGAWCQMITNPSLNNPKENPHGK